MAAVIYIALYLGVIFLGWLPFFYRRFSRDGRAHPLGRAILWFACLFFLAILISDVTFRHPVVSLLPLVLLGAPLPLNLFILIRDLATTMR